MEVSFRIHNTLRYTLGLTSPDAVNRVSRVFLTTLSLTTVALKGNDDIFFTI